MGLINGRELGGGWSDEQVRGAAARRRAWRASGGFDVHENPYWDDELGVYLLELHEDDKAILADAFLDTLHDESAEGGAGT